jgi:acetoin utilization deacetylase AcuC-like enzyme
MPLIVIASHRFTEHETPPGHPERTERAEVMDVVAARWRDRGGEVVAPRAATHEQLARVHDEEYLRRIAATAGHAMSLDPDTYTSPETHDIALLAAGSAIDGVERVMSASETASLAMVRPPGHHAERAKAMGFCFYNNVAVAAAHAHTLGAKRVAIIDYDVHHGNGTQHTFEADASVLYVSLHQYPFYPGTGAVGEIGTRSGRGFTVNVPMEAGAVAEDYRIAFAEIVVPVVRQYQPDVILVSAGFDAHERDPLANMRLTTDTFAAMTADLRLIASESCHGRIALVTEGGYDLQALASSLSAVIQTLSWPAEPGKWPAADSTARRGRTAVDAAKRTLAPFWKL